ncbi:MAG: hypothetical protein ACRDG3_12240, partial [Tepidiformaceae bacterium]
MSVLICVSATEAETEQLLDNGPRRDFVELAKATGGHLLYQPTSKLRNRALRKLAGPHIREAWR